MAKGNDLFLVGGGQLGCLYAVYDFVEDNLGFRHYFWRDDGFVVDKVGTVVFKGRATRRRPAFTGYRNDQHERRDEALFEVRNRGNGRTVEMIVPGYRFKFGGRIPGHGFNPLLLPPDDPPREYAGVMKGLDIRGEFAAHPEWFSLDRNGKRVKDAQICLSNPGARQKLLDNLVKWIDGRGAGVYMVGSNDNHNDRYCWCENCVALEEKYKSVGGPLWDWILWACPQLERMGYANAYVKSLAYKGPKQTERAPASVGKFPRNFVCDAAFLNADRPLADVPDMTLEDGTVFNRLKNLQRWCELCDHVAYWYYGGSNPAQVYVRLQTEMRELHAAGVKSVGACGTGGAWDFGDFTHWIFFRLLRDPDVDLEPDLKRIFEHEYGPAASLVREYVDALDACRRKAVGTMAQTTDTDRMYDGFGYLTGEDLLGFRDLMDRALARMEGTPYARRVRYARFGLNVWTVTMFAKIRTSDPAAAAKIDLGAIDAESRAAADEYVEEHMSGVRSYRRQRLCYHSPVVSLDQMANYANLKDDALPRELAAYPKEKVALILPPKQRQIVRPSKPSVPSCLADPEAASGFAWYDFFDAARVKPPVELGYLKVECYDEGTQTWILNGNRGRIPLEKLIPGKYTLVRLAEVRIPSHFWMVFGGYWGGRSSIKELARLYDPSYQNRQWEIWLSVKAEGPKFFKDAPESQPSRLLVDRVYCVDKGVPAGK